MAEADIQANAMWGWPTVPLCGLRNQNYINTAAACNIKSRSETTTAAKWASLTRRHGADTSDGHGADTAVLPTTHSTAWAKNFNQPPINVLVVAPAVHSGGILIVADDETSTANSWG